MSKPPPKIWEKQQVIRPFNATYWTEKEKKWYYTKIIIEVERENQNIAYRNLQFEEKIIRFVVRSSEKRVLEHKWRDKIIKRDPKLNIIHNIIPKLGTLIKKTPHPVILTSPFSWPGIHLKILNKAILLASW